MLLLRDGQSEPTVVRREDYSAPAFFINTVDLTFDLDPAKTRVLNRMNLRRNPQAATQSLKLDGEDINLARVLVNGQGTSFKMEGRCLVLEYLPEGMESFNLEIFTNGKSIIMGGMVIKPLVKFYPDFDYYWQVPLMVFIILSLTMAYPLWRVIQRSKHAV